VRVLASVLFATLLLAALPALAHAEAPTPELIQRAERGGQLDRSRADLYRTYALAAPERLPAAFRSRAPWDGTLTLLQIRRDLPRLRQAAREEIQALLAPQPSGEFCSSSKGNQANVLNTTNFYITYDTVGAGLTAAKYATSLETSWQTEVGSFGWAAPPAYTTPAPGNGYHVRIDDLANGLYGYVDVVGTYAGLVGNNLATSWNDGDAYASCMVLNSDYSGFPSTPQASLDSTTAHEFNHSIQFGYGALTGTNTPDQVFTEGGATWMEDEVHDTANDNYNYLWPVFSDSMGDYDNSPYRYWVTFRGLTERYGTTNAGGSEQVMQDFWELTSKNASSNQDAIAAALAARGTTLADAFHAYAVAVKFNRACGGGYAYPYCFEEGPAYVAKRGATPVSATVSSVGGSATSSVEDNYALAWVALPSSSSPYNVTLTNTTTGQLRGTVACDTGTGLQLSPLPNIATAGQTTSTLVGFNPVGCTTRVLVVTNQAQTGANPTSSTLRSFSVGTSAGPPPTMRTLSVTKTGSGSGTVTSSPGGISCGGDCSQSYTDGTSVTLSAAASAGSTFTGWNGGGCSGTAPCTITMDANRSVSANFDLVPDNQDPETSITGGPSGTISDRTPTFTFASNEAGSSFSCTVDSGTAVACASPYTTGTLGDGQHTFSVAARDPAGNVDDSPATRSFTVKGAPPPDKDPPETTITGGPGGGTSDSSPTFSFASDEAGSTFVCQVDQALPAPCSSPHTTQQLGSGSHVFSVYARDAAGNQDPTPAGRGFTVLAPTDSLAPAITRLRFFPSAFRAARSGAALTSAAGARLTVRLSEDARVTFRVLRLKDGRRVRLRGRIVRELTKGTTRLRYRGRLRGRALRPGKYLLVARARDAAGNLSSRRRAAFRIVR
jgi:Divergent InlB B-repeat domain